MDIQDIQDFFRWFMGMIPAKQRTKIRRCSLPAYSFRSSGNIPFPLIRQRTLSVHPEQR